MLDRFIQESFVEVGVQKVLYEIEGDGGAATARWEEGLIAEGILEELCCTGPAVVMRAGGFNGVRYGRGFCARDTVKGNDVRDSISRTFRFGTLSLGCCSKHRSMQMTTINHTNEPYQFENPEL